MVRNYKRKTDRALQYTKEVLHSVLNEIVSGERTILDASKHYQIPYSTLQSHLRKKRGEKSKSFGRPSAIPIEEVTVLAEGIKTMSKWGFGLSRHEVMELVCEYVTKNNIRTSFSNNQPGEDWFLAFKKRHNLSIKKPETLEYSRKKATDPFVIGEYFSLLQNTLKELDLENKPGQIYNLDESGFGLDPSKTKVVSEKNSPCSRVTSGPGREATSVLLGGSAAGQKLPPPIIFKGKNMWDTWMADEAHTFPGTSYAATPNGWMEMEVSS